MSKREIILIVSVLSASACGSILGLDDFTDAPADAAGSTTTTSASTSDAGGAGGGGPACEPGVTVVCYEGPQGTEGKGACKSGAKTCLSDGTAFGDCNGDVVPAATDDCTAKVDTTCDDQLDCSCDPNTTEPCYDGPAGTEDVGTCVGGMRTCNADGTGYGACVGQVLPDGVETCGNTADDDCDGVVDQNCACTPATTQPCYSGPATTEGIGACVGGTQTCNAQGNAWGPCNGEVVPQSEACDVAGDEDCDGVPCSETIWQKLVHGPAVGEVFGWNQAAVDSAGAVFVAGTGDGMLDCGDGVALTLSSQGFVVKYDAAGVAQWAKPLPQGASHIAVDGTGRLYVAGGLSGTFSFDGTSVSSNGGTDIYLASYDTAGVLLYATHYGGVGDEFGTGIVAENNGRLTLVGSFSGSFKFPATPNTLGPAANGDAFVARLLSNGSALWSLSIGDATGQPAANQAPTAVGVDPGGNAYVAGDFYQSIKLAGVDHVTLGNSDVWLAKFLSNGTPAWGRVMGGTAADTMSALAVDGAGAAVITGSVGASASFGGAPLPYAGGALDAFAAKLDTNGTTLWSQDIGTAGYDLGDSVSIDGAGNVVLSGSFNGSLTIGGFTVAPSGVYLAKMDPAGTAEWVRGFSGTNGVFGSICATAPATGRIAIAFFSENGGTVDLGLGPMSGTSPMGPVGLLHP